MNTVEYDPPPIRAFDKDGKEIPLTLEYDEAGNITVHGPEGHIRFVNANE